MLTMWDVYWVTRLDEICWMFAVAMIVTGFIFGLSSIGYPFVKEEVFYGDNKRMNRFMKINLAVFVSVCVIGSFVPSTKEACAIYLLPKIVNNEQVQKLPDNAMKLLNGKMEAWIDDMTKERGK